MPPPGNGTFTLRGKDGAIVIKEGEWYINPKAHARRMMLNSLPSDARRVYACLELATMGFSQELAVTMEGGKKRPLTPLDIQKDTRLPRQKVRRGLEDLEKAGLAERRADDKNGLRRGHVLIYCWAVPRSAGAEKFVAARGYKVPEWFPDEARAILPLFSYFKIPLTQDSVRAQLQIPALEKAARSYNTFLDEFARVAETVCAHGFALPASLIERKGKEIRERNNNNSSCGGARGAPEKAVVAAVLEAIGFYGRTTQEAAEKLVKECRRVKPGCSAEAIVQTIHDLAAGFDRRRVTNPVGVLLTQVSEALLTAPATPKEMKQAKLEADARKILANPAEWKDDPGAIEWAEQTLKHLDSFTQKAAK